MKIIFKKSKKEFSIRKDYQVWYEEKYCLKAVERNGYALQYVKEKNSFIKIITDYEESPT